MNPFTTPDRLFVSRRPQDMRAGIQRLATHQAGGPAYDPAHYAEAMAGKRWFGDAAGDIEAAAAANLGLLDSVGGSL